MGTRSSPAARERSTRHDTRPTSQWHKNHDRQYISASETSIGEDYTRPTKVFRSGRHVRAATALCPCSRGSPSPSPSRGARDSRARTYLDQARHEAHHIRHLGHVHVEVVQIIAQRPVEHDLASLPDGGQASQIAGRVQLWIGRAGQVDLGHLEGRLGRERRSGTDASS